ncbi:hypothetical protein [Paenibacillus thalictri]|uniref:Uncharacterized protein n=1 Tax=Paenibacillus thalictri TaxID=2527873 RepID=A0A4Q9DQZ0_9BACL|nr:hypothetical protein [Paenibacillus thalictri]TBL77431.1 hypothetical protein EYB31_18345 [Paenibacillus thalictri]
MLIIGLNQLLRNFGINLTQYEFNQYIPKLRDYFFPFLLQEKKHVTDAGTLFKFELTRSDIVKSTEYYILKNEKVKSKSAIDDFLTALNCFFEEEIYEKYPNQNLMNIRPFNKLSSEIENRLNTRIIESRWLNRHLT